MRRAWAGFQRREGLKQIAIVLAALGVYEVARSFIEPNWGAAIANAERIAELERGLSFAWEQSLQRAFLSVPELVEAMNVFYFAGHFVLTGVFFLWLYRVERRLSQPPQRVHRRDCDRGRHPLVVPDGAACRRRPFSNPVAAVPSLHAGWAVGVGVGLVRFAKQPALRVFGVVYPVVVMLTIVVTGNHFIFDALAGIAVLAAGFHGHGNPRDPAPGIGLAYLTEATRGGAVR